MTTPQFIVWLDAKMAAFGNGKLVPPATVLANDLSETLATRLHRQITDQILREAGIDEKVAATLPEIGLPVPKSHQRCPARRARGALARRHRAGRGPTAGIAGRR